MTETKPKKKKFKVRLDVDLNAILTGYDSAQHPTSAHHRLVKYYSSPLFFGPPPSEDLLELLVHIFTEDEADLVQHLPPFRPRTAEKVAALSGRKVKEVTWVFEHLAKNKNVILALGDPRKFTILPIIPGVFEMTLMTPDISEINAWHKRFVEIFDRIWGTGFIKDYVSVSPPLVRFLPATNVSNTLFMAWPSERLEEILDRYDKFAIGHCQCRIATRLIGQGCNKPTENCVWFGPLADIVLDRGLMREISRQDVIAVKQEAEQHACITWMVNEFGDPRGNVSCSCCGCCCHALKTINQFSAPGLVSSPHFAPQVDLDTCNMCGKCVDICPTGTWRRIGAQLYFDAPRCIGCGLCTTVCKVDALELKPRTKARPPEKSWAALFGKTTPAVFRNAFRVWAKRTLAAARRS